MAGRSVIRSDGAARKGEALTGTIREITGREPRTFAAWARENVRAFAKSCLKYVRSRM